MVEKCALSIESHDASSATKVLGTSKTRLEFHSTSQSPKLSFTFKLSTVHSPPSLYTARRVGVACELLTISLSSTEAMTDPGKSYVGLTVQLKLKSPFHAVVRGLITSIEGQTLILENGNIDPYASLSLGLLD